MKEKIIEILKIQDNLFDFEIIEILISKYGYSVFEKEWYINKKLRFQAYFIVLLEENGIKVSCEKHYLGDYYSYYHRFKLG